MKTQTEQTNQTHSVTNAVTDSAATVTVMSESTIRVKVDSTLQASSQSSNTSWGEGAYEQSLHIVLYDTERADTNGTAPVKAVIDRSTKATRRDSVKAETINDVKRKSNTLMGDSTSTNTLNEVVVKAERNAEYNLLEYAWEKVKTVNSATLYWSLFGMALIVAIIVWIRIKKIL